MLAPFGSKVDQNARGPKVVLEMHQAFHISGIFLPEMRYLRILGLKKQMTALTLVSLNPN